MTIETIMKQMDGIESSIKAHQEKANEEIKNLGKVADDTKNALDNLGEKQREVADRLLALEQAGHVGGSTETAASVGKQYVESSAYKNFQAGNTQKARFEVQNNTLTGSDATVAPDRKPGIVPGDFHFLTLEDVFPSVPTSSNAIEFTKEASFTNSAAEAAEAAEKAESALTWSLVNMPVSTVAHWIKISRQLAMDSAALASYVNQRMIYGVNRRVETQLGAGNGTAPNISGILDTGNYTAHGYAAANLGTLKKVNLVTKIIGQLWAVGAVPDAILMNPADWAQIQVDIVDSAVSAARVDFSNPMAPRLNGIPVIQSNGITADTVVVGAFRQAGTIYNREGVVVEMSDSDDDNFTKNLITIRAERRLALTIERPSYIIGGDLTPA
jgi:HK97 family phage major capsid protein